MAFLQTNPLQKLTLIAAMTATLALTACDVIAPMPGSSASASSSDPASGAIFQPTTVEDVAAAFLDAWGRRDYDAMYAFLSSEAQANTPAPVFRATYDEADRTIGTSGVRYTLGEVEELGRAASLTYDLVLESGTFGEIPDSGRTMRFSQTAAGYRISWTTMDIFDGYAAGMTLAADTRREPRGNIYDRNNVPMVEQDSEVVGLSISRSTIPDPEACFTLLGTVLRRQRGDIIAQFERFDPSWVFGFGEIDPAEYARYQGQLTSLCNVTANPYTSRRYAGHGAAAHITGYIGQQTADEQAQLADQGYGPGDLIGKVAIEQQYETQLAGAAARVLQITTPDGMVIREIAGATGTPPQDVYLTIDWNLQLAMAQALADAYNYAEPNWANRAHSTGGGLVALDVNTGAVLALASFPTYDPGLFNPDASYWLAGDFIGSLTTDPRRPFRNRVIEEQYPPGSTFKIITTAAAAAENLWPEDELFYCGRRWEGRQYGDSYPARFDWRNAEPEEANFDTGEVSIAHALSASCNPFFYQMGAMLYTDRGQNVLTDYARRMGLGRPTGIDLTPREAPGQIIPPTGADAAISIAIGQLDTQVTIIQMARLSAGIANGGTLYRPYIVQNVGREGEAATYTGEPTAEGDMGLSERVLGIVREGMCDATDSSVFGTALPVIDGLETPQRIGTSWFVFSDPDNVPAPYTVCGKTGTAQTTRPEPMGWFVAYAPADNPQIAIAGMIEHGREGSETIAPIIRRTLDAYFGVQPGQVQPYPNWWPESYRPLNVPEGSTGG